MSEVINLMNKNTVVMRFNFDEGVYDIKSEKYMPFQLKGKINKMPEIKNNMTKYEMTQYLINLRKIMMQYCHFYLQEYFLYQGKMQKKYTTYLVMSNYKMKSQKPR